MVMFVVAEVHPFSDGNGRTARLAMNCMLSARALSRIIIPTVYREDYLLPLKALSHNRFAEPLISALCRAQRWSAAFDYSSPRAQLRESLARCNAFQEDLRNYKLLTANSVLVIVQLHADGSRLIDGPAREVRDVARKERIIDGFDRTFVG
jgi:Fic/DOC family